jgi:hypothetical protein
MPRVYANNIGLECGALCAYSPPMDDNPTQAITPAGWLEALAESEAQLTAGLTVPGEAVRQRLYDALARLEAKQVAAGPSHDAPRR